MRLKPVLLFFLLFTNFFSQSIADFPPNENIIYFYSDALLNTLEDGNGFTDKHVFSYWKDDDSGFQFENEALKNIKK